jgi:hypothetical protein
MLVGRSANLAAIVGPFEKLGVEFKSNGGA